MSDDEREELSTNSPFIIEPNVMLTAEGEEESAINTVVNDKWNIKAISADVDNSDEIDTVKVAVIDSGVDYGEDIKIAQSVSLIDDETKGFDVTGHGTAVEGIIGASDNGIGTTGVAPGEEIYSIKVLDDDNRVPVSRIIEALYWCIENKINIVNLSMGMPYDSTSLRSTINACTKEGILIVASAGNAGNGGSVLYPAAYDEVFAVSATNSKNELSSIGIFGDEVDIVAPGENIPLNSFYDGVTVGSGTSYAAAHITGVAARLWAMDRSKSADFIKELIKASAVPLDVSGCGAGIADLEYAKSIYSVFEKKYQTTDGDIPFLNNIPSPEYSLPAYLEANWQGQHHMHLVTVGSTGTSLSSAELTLLKNASQWSDKKLSEDEYKNGGFTYGNGFHFFHAHGKTNYVAVTKYLYNVAVRVKNGVSVTSASNVTLYNPNNLFGDNYNLNVTQQKQVLSEAIKKIYNAEVDGQSGVKNANIRNSLKILGLALHVAEDAYAHKSIVPKNEWNSTIRAICAEYYKKTAQLDEIAEKVNNETETFSGLSDLKENNSYVLTDTKRKNLHRDTADSITVCSHRYNRASKWACTKMITWYNQSDDSDRKYFTAEVFYPNMESSTNYNYKLFELVKRLEEVYNNTLPDLGGSVTKSDWEVLSN